MARLMARSLVTALPAAYSVPPSSFVAPGSIVGSDMPRLSTVLHASSSKPATACSLYVAEAVSYTHLDVYKRQVLLARIETGTGGLFGGHALDDIGRRAPKQQRERDYHDARNNACLLYTSRCV